MSRHRYQRGSRPVESCPEAAVDPALNEANRRRATVQFGFGPETPGEPPPLFWPRKSAQWGIPPKLAALRRCGNCGVYDVSGPIVACGAATADGGRGFCQGHQFTCSAFKVCDTWSPGGPKVL